MHTPFARPVGFLTAFLVVILTVVTVERALATTTVPNASKTTLTASSGGDSANLALASSTGPVEVIIAHTTVSFRGVSMAVMQAPTSFALLQWTGVDSGGTPFSSFTSSSGVLMYQVGFGTSAQLVSSGPSSFHMHNNIGGSNAIVVTQIW